MHMRYVAAGIAAELMFVVAALRLGAAEAPAVTALPPIETAASDPQGRITVNGKPFFPILMYDVPVDVDSLKMFREHGFNVLSARVEDASMLRKQGFYTAAHGAPTAGLALDGV